MAKEVNKGSKKPTSKALASKIPRQRKLTARQKRQVTKKEARSRNQPPSSFKLTAEVVRIIKTHWKILGGIVLVYLILNIIFASGLSSISDSVNTIRANLSGDRHFWSALGDFGSLVGSAGSSNSQTSSILQAVLIVIESLVIIWALRQLLAGNKIRVKQAYYQSMSPLLPFILVTAVIFLQLLPVTLGTSVIAIILSAILSSGGLLTALMVIFFIILATWSLYMISSSIFALYIVTLPDMQPRQALKSAKNLVRYKRAAAIRKVLFLPVFVLVVMAIVIVPLILYAQVLVAPVFYVLSMLAILFVHTYLYSLYRSMLE